MNSHGCEHDATVSPFWTTSEAARDAVDAIAHLVTQLSSTSRAFVADREIIPKAVGLLVEGLDQFRAGSSGDAPPLA